MKLKNKEDFLKLREKIKKKGKTDHIKLLVGYGTCGIAAGARDIIAVLNQHFEEKSIANIELVKVGCVGFCHAEPTIEVVYPDGDSVLLGYLTTENIEDIIDLHILNKTTKSNHVLKKNVASRIAGGKV